jgi:DNA-binding HxlR family transcriptional regulator
MTQVDEGSRGVLHIDDEECRRVAGVMDVVGRRWASGILLALGRGAGRFSEILELVDGLSRRMLAVRLRELESSGLVDREVIATTPVSVRYQLTARGVDLLRSLRPMALYAQRWEPPTESEPQESMPPGR